jgi:hypothetical protein
MITSREFTPHRIFGGVLTPDQHAAMLDLHFELLGCFNDDWFLDKAPGTVSFIDYQSKRLPSGSWDCRLIFATDRAQTYILGKPLYKFGSLARLRLDQLKEMEAPRFIRTHAQFTE